MTVFFLARAQAALYFMNNIDNEAIFKKAKKHLLVSGGIFVVFFLAFVAVLLLSDGYEINADGTIGTRAYKYFFNLIEMPWVAVLFIVGVVAVLYGMIRSLLAEHYTKGIWFSGIGTVLVVLSLFFLAGYNQTPYYPSTADLQSSLTIYNSSSSLFTLQTMSVVSLLIPFVLAYIVYVWRAMNAQPITEKEMKETDHKY